MLLPQELILFALNALVRNLNKSLKPILPLKTSCSNWEMLFGGCC